MKEVSVSKLTDYIDLVTLGQLQETFCNAAGARVHICRPDGSPVLDRFKAADAAVATDVAAGGSKAQEWDVPIVIDDHLVGRVRMFGHASSDGQHSLHGSVQGLLQLMADLLKRLHEGERQLRLRTEELAALFALTAEFAAQRDLQAVLDLATRTVVRSLKAKACNIRLLSEDRTELVNQSVANFSSEYLNKGRILVSQSKIDQEVLTTGRPVYIADERTDPRVLYPKEAAREGIVSALCAPLSYKGRAEGVIRVYTGEVHVFDWFEIAMLQSIATQAAAAIVNARLHQDALAAADIKRQLKTASEVQRRLTPDKAPKIPGFEVGAVYVPCFELGGDFYDFINLPPDNYGVAICDVAGKGIPASLLMASIRGSLRAHAMNIYDMSTVLDRVNRDLCADTLIGSFATMFYGVIDYKTRRLTYANAGHVPPILIRGGQCCHLTTGGGILGISPGEHWRHEHFTLHPNDVIVACTDGLTDAINHAEEPFGRARIESSALAAIAQGQNAEGIARHILWEMRRFAGIQTRFDDLTLVVIKVQ